MGKLLSANFARLGKNKVFWFSLLIMLGLSAFSMANDCRQAVEMRADGYQVFLDSYYFELAPCLGLFFSVFMSLFLGTEYSDGTIRNKVVIGHTRSSVYLANLLTCIISSLCITAAWLIGGLVGIPTLGAWRMGSSGVLLYLLISVLFSVALSAIFTFIGVISSNKAATAVISILMFLGLLIGASIIYNKLCEPDMLSGVVITSEGMQMAEPSPNPDYIGGTMRRVYELVLNILPTGQMILMSNLEIERPVLQMASSAAITVVVTAAGVGFFRKKDLK